MIKSIEFQRTIKKNLCHKNNIHEVFLTDLVYNEVDNSYYLGAVKPPNHRYYSEKNHDEIFLLECCRQAMISVAHEYLNISHESKFVFTTLELSNLTNGIENLNNFLLKAVLLQDENNKSESKLSQRFCISISDGNMDIFHSKMSVKFIKTSSYNRIRRFKEKVNGYVYHKPQLLDRFYRNGLGIEERNILISNLEDTENGIKTRLNINLSNTSIIEHRHDHISAIVLIDAVVQTSICYLHNIFYGSKWRLVNLQSRYNKFVELIALTNIEIYPEKGVNFSDKITIKAKVVQGDDISAEFILVFKVVSS